jgi:hypothetical protein
MPAFFGKFKTNFAIMAGAPPRKTANSEEVRREKKALQSENSHDKTRRRA